MEFLQGGTLYKHIKDVKRLAEDEARFYAAQLALAIGHLHKSKVLYRDLKPENILLGDDGYIKLADFGLAKIVASEKKTTEVGTFCGTPEYLAPEIITREGQDQTLDWWALGILIYEMIIGVTPFYNANTNKMYFMVTNGPIRWPDRIKHGIYVSPDA